MFLDFPLDSTSHSLFLPALTRNRLVVIACAAWSSAQDHGPDSDTEWRRIHELDAQQYPNKLLFVYDKNNVFKKYTCPRVFRADGVKDPVYVDNPWGMGLHPTNVRYDPAVYAVSGPEVTRDTTCIAMTRSLGACVRANS